MDKIQSLKEQFQAGYDEVTSFLKENTIDGYTFLQFLRGEELPKEVEEQFMNLDYQSSLCSCLALLKQPQIIMSSGIWLDNMNSGAPDMNMVSDQYSLDLHRYKHGYNGFSHNNILAVINNTDIRVHDIDCLAPGQTLTIIFGGGPSKISIDKPTCKVMDLGIENTLKWSEYDGSVLRDYNSFVAVRGSRHMYCMLTNITSNFNVVVDGALYSLGKSFTIYKVDESVYPLKVANNKISLTPEMTDQYKIGDIIPISFGTTFIYEVPEKASL